MPSKFDNYILVEDRDLLKRSKKMRLTEKRNEQQLLSNQEISRVENRFQYPAPIAMPVFPHFLGGPGSNPSMVILKAASVVGGYSPLTESLCVLHQRQCVLHYIL